VVPEVVDAWSTRSVLTTRWEPGASLEEYLATDPPQAERDRAGAALFRASVHGFAQLGLLHADPHPGNFAFRDGRVVLYDFGCVRRFEPVHVEAFRAMGLALRANDRPAVVRAAQRFGFRLRGDDAPALLERFARSFFAPMLKDGPSVIPPETAVDVRQLAQDKLALRKLGLPPKLLFLLRLRFGLYAVLSRLGARCDWAALELQAGRVGDP
jgi:predicted unusual protein kinase regulating ubiquinone biosynthesis (AarF/ABC1/UbiB family)